MSANPGRHFFSPKIRSLLHGGDYNPDQWLAYPEVFEQDMRLMKKAGVNAVSVGIFSWAALEPEDGRYEFGWLDKVMDRLAKEGIHAILATPSGARPAWMSQKYPEVLQVRRDRRRIIHGGRHNHCQTSPVYRRKVYEMNTQLAKRYGQHPALALWHISNEYGGECHCALCQEAYRNWLKQRYQGSLDALNHAWWNAFWGRTYTDWSQVESPGDQGEGVNHVDWRRFVSQQTANFMEAEIAPLKALAPGIPATSNFMAFFPWLNYWDFKHLLDVVAWDSYPAWHSPEGNDWVASDTAFGHESFRTLGGGKPFLLMECAPSTNIGEVSMPKRPGMHLLASLQALAHGSDSVLYFQWRKGRGAEEKFHGAVVDHDGRDDTRVFKEVSQVGQSLTALAELAGTARQAKVAIVFDWENLWSLDNMLGLQKRKLEYERTCKRHYKPFWDLGIAVDVPSQDADFSQYQLVVLPMLYMLKAGTAEKLEAFVKAGGTLVVTYWSGIVDENELCHLGGFPGPLKKLLGIRAEEIDSVYEVNKNSMILKSGNGLGLKGSYAVEGFRERIHLEGAKALASYRADFYKGEPALAVNALGRGQAYYQAARSGDGFLKDFYTALAKKLKLPRALDITLPKGVTAQARTDGKQDYVFVMNFMDKPQKLKLKAGQYWNLLEGKKQGAMLALKPFGASVLKRSFQLGKEPA